MTKQITFIVYVYKHNFWGTGPQNESCGKGGDICKPLKCKIN